MQDCQLYLNPFALRKGQNHEHHRMLIKGVRRPKKARLSCSFHEKRETEAQGSCGLCAQGHMVSKKSGSSQNSERVVFPWFTNEEKEENQILYLHVYKHLQGQI